MKVTPKLIIVIIAIVALFWYVYVHSAQLGQLPMPGDSYKFLWPGGK